MNTTSKVCMLTALVSLGLTIAVTIQQQQDVAAFNDQSNQFVYNTHSHTRCPGSQTLCPSNDGRVLNSADQHSNENFNSNRDPAQKTHSFDKTGNDK